jgi:hypothetical protein
MTPPFEPGLFEININDYLNDVPPPEPSLNNSLIPYLLECPAKARARHPRLSPGFRGSETRKMALGSVSHLLLLGRGRNIQVIEADSYRTNAAKDARDTALDFGKIPILSADMATAEAMHIACVKQLEDFGLDPFSGGKSELAMFWKDAAGCWGRSLIDHLCDDLPTWEDWDYKTTERSVRPEDPALGAFIVDNGYDTAFAVHERGLFTLFPSLAGRLKFRLLFQETQEPYLISVVEPDEATMAIARRKVDYAFNLWAECLRTETFPGYTPRVVTTEHAEFAANRWLKREVEESHALEAQLEPEPERRKPGRPQGSKNVPKKRLLYQMRLAEIQKREEAREAKEKAVVKEGQNPLEGG